MIASAPASLRAQESYTLLDSASSCLRSIPDSLLHRVPVYLQAELADSTDRPVLPGVDLLTQQVADGVRSALGATPTQLPNGEAAVTWRALDAILDVVVHRDGRVASALHRSGSDRVTDTTGTHLLAQSLAALTAGGGYFMLWPDGFERDSVGFQLEMHHTRISEQGTADSLRLRQGFALFTMRVPTEEPVAVRQQHHPKYPETFPEKGVTGDLIMEFIVDTTGRAEMSTVKDVWPKGRPRLTGEQGDYYEAFRRSIVHSIARDRFEPARIGGCKVRQLVQMPFGFRIAR